MDDSFVNLGVEEILTLLWQSGASESATVCFVISLSIYYRQKQKKILFLLKNNTFIVYCLCVSKHS